MLHQPASTKLLLPVLFWAIASFLLLSWETGNSRAGGICATVEFAADAELLPGFDLIWCSFDGQRPAGKDKKALGRCCGFEKHKASQKLLSEQCWKENLLWDLVPLPSSTQNQLLLQGCLCLHPLDKATGPGWILPLPPAAAWRVWSFCR